jgi:hypothetical protein
MLTETEKATLATDARPEVVERLVAAVEASRRSKYRGTTTYHRVMSELILTAERRGLTTYKTVAAIMGLPESGNYMQSELGQILWEIVTDEVAARRPMLGSVVVKANGKVGAGFFIAARELGRLDRSASLTDETFFLEAERLATYDAWARPTA